MSKDVTVITLFGDAWRGLPKTVKGGMSNVNLMGLRALRYRNQYLINNMTHSYEILYGCSSLS